MGRVVLKYDKKYRPELAPHRVDKALDFSGTGMDPSFQTVEEPVTRDKNVFTKDEGEYRCGWWRFLVLTIVIIRYKLKVVISYSQVCS